MANQLTKQFIYKFSLLNRCDCNNMHNVDINQFECGIFFGFNRMYMHMQIAHMHIYEN